jgi:chemotaxis protein MotB
MQSLKVSTFLAVISSFLLLTGCISEQEYRDLKVRNARQEKQLTEVSSKLAAAERELDRCRQELQDAQARGGIDSATLQQKVDAYEKALADKNALIKSMQARLLSGGTLPPELSTMLEDFAKAYDVVSYDPGSGIVKFKSDLLFQRGSDVVAAGASEAVKALCGILNSEQGSQFDVVVAGHTDDIPIRRADTKAKHPTNWHLSAHRAIAVQKIMAQNSVAQERTSVRGFGQYRPVSPNKPNGGGNQQNRRVEIYIVPKGT